MKIFTHKESGWKRSTFGPHWKITPADGSEESVVSFMGPHDWQNLPNDKPENRGSCRVVLISGPELPEWAMQWLNNANERSHARAMENFRSMIDDADNAPFRGAGW